MGPARRRWSSSPSSSPRLRTALLILCAVFAIAYAGLLIRVAQSGATDANDEAKKNEEAKDDAKSTDANFKSVAVRPLLIAEEDKPETDAWEGWQPALANSSSCSWRDCFEEGKKRPCLSFCREEPYPPPPPVSPGWIPDPELVRRMHLSSLDRSGAPFPPPLPPEMCELIGTSGGRHDPNRSLLRTLRVSSEAPVRILCMIYTTEKSHASVRAARETWGGRCAGFLAFSTIDDPRVPAVSIAHEGIGE